MLQADLMGRMTSALSNCTRELRTVALDAAKTLTQDYADAEGFIAVKLADGRNAVLHAEQGIVGIESEYASKVSDLEMLLHSVHNLLGQPTPVNTQTVATPIVTEPAPTAEAPAAEDPAPQ